MAETKYFKINWASVAGNLPTGYTMPDQTSKPRKSAAGSGKARSKSAPVKNRATHAEVYSPAYQTIEERSPFDKQAAHIYKEHV